MKALNKILVIGLVALIAMVCTSAVSAEPVERTVLGNTWNYDIVDDGGDYFIYDGTSDAVDYAIGAWNYTPAPVPVIPDYDIRAKGIGYYDDSGVEYRDTITQSRGGITVDDWNDDTRAGFGQYEYHFYKNDICGDFTGNYADGNGGAIYYTNGMTGGLHDGNLYFYTEPYYTNGMTGSLSDGNGNLLTRDVSGFVVPDSNLNPPRPDINVPYYPTEQTDIVI